MAMDLVEFYEDKHCLNILEGYPGWRALPFDRLLRDRHTGFLIYPFLPDQNIVVGYIGIVDNKFYLIMYEKIDEATRLGLSILNCRAQELIRLCYYANLLKIPDFLTIREVLNSLELDGTKSFIDVDKFFIRSTVEFDYCTSNFMMYDMQIYTSYNYVYHWFKGDRMRIVIGKYRDKKIIPLTEDEETHALSIGLNLIKTPIQVVLTKSACKI